MARDFDDDKPATAAPKGRLPRRVKRPKPAPIALEPRFVFDAAAGAEVVAGVADKIAPEALHRAVTLNEAAASARAHWLTSAAIQIAENHGWQARNPLNPASDSANPAQAEGAGPQVQNLSAHGLAGKLAPHLHELLRTHGETLRESVAARPWAETLERLLDQGDAGQSSEHATLYVIDSRVPDLDSIIAKLPEGSYLLLDPSRDGVEQVTEFLAGRSGVSTLTFVTDGVPGAIQLGSTLFSEETVLENAADLASWRLALTSDADILLLGCDVGAGSAGDTLLNRLAALTGADVAASVDKTGAAALGGDLILEKQVGHIEQASLDSMKVLEGYEGVLAVTIASITANADGVINRSEINTSGLGFTTSLTSVTSDGDVVRVQIYARSGTTLGALLYTENVTITGNGNTRNNVAVTTANDPLAAYTSQDIAIVFTQGSTATGTFVAGTGTGTTSRTDTTYVGSNATPTITNVTNPAAIGELTNAAAQDIPATAGSISVTDTNPGQTLTGSVAGAATILYNGSATLPAGVNVAALGLQSALTFTNTVVSNGAAQTLNYSYNPTAVNLDWLKQGDTLTITYAARVSDGTATSATSNIVITITGANDGPTLNAPTAITLTDTAANDPFPATTGTLTAIDADNGDTKTYAIAGAGVSSGSFLRADGLTYDRSQTNAHGTLYLLTTTGQYRFEPNAAALNALTAAVSPAPTFQLTVTDGQGSTSAAQNLTLNITGVNDTAVIGDPTSAAVTEDTSVSGGNLTATGTVSITDRDTGQSSFQAGSVPGGSNWGSLSFGTNGAYTYTLSNSDSRVQALAAGATHTDTFTITAADGSQKVISFTVTGTNDAPVLDVTKNPILTSVSQDAGAPTGDVGTLVSSLLTGAVTDVDGSSPGLALTGVNSANGTWWYKTAGGSWTQVGAVSASSALLLDSTARLYFQPNAGFSGSLTDAVTFKAWDKSSGADGSTANTGSGSAFSSSSDTAAISVKKSYSLTSSNDDFNVILAGTNYDPYNDTQSKAADTDLIGDADTPLLMGAYDSGTNDLYFRVRIDNPTISKGVPVFTGVLLLGIDVNADGKIDAFVGVDGRNSGLGVVTYAPGSGLNAGPSTTSITDQQSVVAGSPTTPAKLDYMSYALAADGDAGGNGKTDAYLTFRVPFAVLEARIQALLPAVDLTPGSSMAFVLMTLTQNNSINGDIGGVGQLTNAQKNLTWDQLGVLKPVSFSAPTLENVSGGVTHTENGAATQIAPAATVQDLDTDDFGAGSLNVTLAGGEGADQLGFKAVGGITVSGSNVLFDGTVIGTYTADSTSLTLTFVGGGVATKAAVQAAIQAVAYSTTSDMPSTATRTASFTLRDPEANASALRTVNVFVTPVNDAPTVSGTTQSRLVVNGATYLISTAGTGDAILLASGQPSGFTIGDPDASGAVVQASFSVPLGVIEVYNGTTLVSSTGSTVFGGVTVTGSGTGTITLSGTVASINAFLAGGTSAQLLYQPGNFEVPSEGEQPQPIDVTLKVNDLGNSGQGGPLTQSVTFASIEVTGPPKIVGELADVVTEDTAVVGGNLSATGLIEEEGGADLSDLTVTFQGNTLGDASPLGTFSVQGESWTYTVANGSSAIQNLGPGESIQETYKVQAEVNGVTTFAYVTVTIDGVNDAPTLTVTSVNPTFGEGGTPVDLFSSPTVSTIENYQQIEQLTVQVGSVADPQAEYLRVDGTLVSLANGTTATTTNGLTVVVSTVDGTATVTITSAAGLSAAATATLVDGLAYQNTGEILENASRTVTITSLTDTGGSDGAGDDTAALNLSTTVSLTPVNDGPVLSTAPFSVNEGRTVPITTDYLSAADPDTATSALTYTLLTAPTHGTLQYDSTGAGNWISVPVGSPSFTQADVDAGRVRFVATPGVPNGTADSMNFEVSDGSLTSQKAVGITIVNTNAAPISYDSSVTVAEDGTHVFELADFLFSDPDTGDTVGFIEIQEPASNGTLEYSTNGTDWITVSGVVQVSKAHIDNGWLRFRPDANENGADYTNFDFTILDAQGAESAASEMAVHVTAVNDAPVLAAVGTITFADGAIFEDFGDQTGTLSQTDVDAGDTHTYAID
ncbi:MAG TPA: VCBS domain-containing protein, partial [Caulobacteraceae bacterium]|nr:VCBS domain-containing protein [Caulobacteraceae bacterium]